MRRVFEHAEVGEGGEKGKEKRRKWIEIADAL